MKNKKVMSVAIYPELQEAVSKCSRRKGLSLSSYIGNLIEQAVKLDPDDDHVVVAKPANEKVKAVFVPDDENIKSIILKIPVQLKEDPEQLKKWLSTQVASLYKKLLEKE